MVPKRVSAVFSQRTRGEVGVKKRKEERGKRKEKKDVHLVLSSQCPCHFRFDYPRWFVKKVEEKRRVFELGCTEKIERGKHEIKTRDKGDK